jgi:hypothetical protein
MERRSNQGGQWAANAGNRAEQITERLHQTKTKSLRQAVATFRTLAGNIVASGCTLVASCNLRKAKKSDDRFRSR